MPKFGTHEVDGEHLPESQDEAISQGRTPEPRTCREKALTKVVVEVVERALKSDRSGEDMTTSYHRW